MSASWISTLPLTMLILKDLVCNVCYNLKHLRNIYLSRAKFSIVNGRLHKNYTLIEKWPYKGYF